MSAAKWDIAKPVRVKWRGLTSCRYFCEYSYEYLVKVKPDKDGYVSLSPYELVSILHHCHENNEDLPFDQIVDVPVEK